jgi:1,3-beta-glucan synthase
MSRGNSRSHNNSWIGYCRLSRTMITGYKKKKLGKPSEKLSGDVPRAGWRAVIVSEVLFPIFFAILLVIAYMFVKSFPVAGQTPPSPLIRISVVSIGPVVWNAAVLLVLFLVSLFLGPMLDSCCVRFGAVMATIAHILGTIGMIGFFEFFVSLPIVSKYCFTLLNSSTVVVSRALEHITCRPWSHHYRGNSTRHSQSVDLRVSLARI